MKKFLLLACLIGLSAVSAQAAITVDTATALADMGTAFTAILGVVVLGFGFKKISGMFGR